MNIPFYLPKELGSLPRSPKNLKNLNESIILFILTIMFFVINTIFVNLTANTEFRQVLKPIFYGLTIPLSGGVVFAFARHLAKKKFWKTVYVIIEILFIIITVWVHVIAYVEWFKPPKILTGKITNIQVIIYDKSKNYENDGFCCNLQLEVDKNFRWELNQGYGKRKIDYYYRFYQKYLGKTVEISYSDLNNTVFAIKQGNNFLYKALDPCLKFIDKNNSCI